MTFVESIKYYRKIILFFIGILAIIICLVMSKYNVEFFYETLFCARDEQFPTAV